MTCAQGLLRLLWGGPEVGVLRDWPLLLKRKPLSRKKILFVFKNNVEDVTFSNSKV